MLLLVLLFSYGTYAQNYTIECGKLIKKGVQMKIDTLIQDCYEVLLLQDNSTIEIYKAEINTQMILKYGDTGGDTLKGVVYDTLRQIDIEGKLYYDVRPRGDVNPKVIFWNIEPSPNIVVDAYIDVEYKTDYDTANGNTDFPESELRKLQSVVYDFSGKTLYKGLYADLFDSEGKIDCRYANTLLIVRFKNNAGWFAKKRYYVDYKGNGDCD